MFYGSPLSKYVDVEELASQGDGANILPQASFFSKLRVCPYCIINRCTAPRRISNHKVFYYLLLEAIVISNSGCITNLG